MRGLYEVINTDNGIEKCKCGFDLVFEPTPNLVHYGKVSCPKHGFIRWVKNPEKPLYRDKTTRCNIDLNKCIVCGRARDELGAKEAIQAHHLEPLEEGGKDVEENLIAVCSACHKLMHWARLYMGKHFKGKFNDFNSEAAAESDISICEDTPEGEEAIRA